VIKISHKILSATAINMYLRCPRKYYLRYIKKLRTKTSIFLIRGSIVHKTIEKFNQNQPAIFQKLPEKMVRYELIRTFNDLWETANDRLNALGLSSEQLGFYHDDSERMLVNFSKWFCQSTLAPATKTELKLFSNNLGLMGIIDAVHKNDEKDILIDYKTSKQAKITDDIRRQAALYALLYKDKFKKVPESVRIHFLTEPGEPQIIYIDEHLLEYGNVLIDHVREMTVSTSKKSYPCKCGGYCERDFIS
jgi:CRISPR/Cas system-associated exonuclease Cas4 (RecB family)